MVMERTELDELLSQIRNQRASVLAELNDLTEADFSRSTHKDTWLWNTLLRVLLQFGNHMREHATQVDGIRDSIDRRPTQPQRILAQAEASWGLLLASLVGLEDADLDAPPPDGGWTLRQTLEHIYRAEQDYLEAIRKARPE